MEGFDCSYPDSGFGYDGLLCLSKPGRPVFVKNGPAKNSGRYEGNSLNFPVRLRVYYTGQAQRALLIRQWNGA